MRNATRVLAVLPLLLALVACGGEESEAAPTPETVTATTTVTVTETAAAAPTSSASATEAAATDLKVGQWREGAGARTMVARVVQPDDAVVPSYLEGDPGAEGAVVTVRQCVRPEAEGELWVSSFNFVGLDGEGGRYTASGTSWNEWPPVPQFPSDASITAGECVKGNLVLTAPSEARIKSVALVLDGTTIAQWRIR